MLQFCQSCVFCWSGLFVVIVNCKYILGPLFCSNAGLDSAVLPILYSGPFHIFVNTLTRPTGPFFFCSDVAFLPIPLSVPILPILYSALVSPFLYLCKFNYILGPLAPFSARLPSPYSNYSNSIVLYINMISNFIQCLRLYYFLFQ